MSKAEVFLANEAVPDWLVTVLPQEAGTSLDGVYFTIDTVMIETETHFTLVPMHLDDLFKYVLAIKGAGRFRVNATGKPVAMGSGFVALCAPGEGTVKVIESRHDPEE
jgi:hypothetical protein